SSAQLAGSSLRVAVVNAQQFDASPRVVVVNPQQFGASPRVVVVNPQQFDASPRVAALSASFADVRSAIAFHIEAFGATALAPARLRRRKEGDGGPRLRRRLRRSRGLQ